MTRIIQNNTPENLFAQCYRLLDQIDAQLDTDFGVNNIIQRPFDMLAQGFNDMVVAPLSQVSVVIDTYEPQEVALKVAALVIRPILQTVRNIIRLAYSIFYHVANLVFHPLKEMVNIVRLLVDMIEQLSNPENWSRIGAGLIGTSVGLSLIPGNPLSAFTLIIGTALAVTGLAVGLINAYYEDGDFGENLERHAYQHLKDMSEAFLTGMTLGVISGSIVRAIDGSKGVNSRYDYQQRAEVFGRKWRPSWFFSKDIDYKHGTMTVTDRFWHQKWASYNLRITNPAVLPSQVITPMVSGIVAAGNYQMTGASITDFEDETF